MNTNENNLSHAFALSNFTGQDVAPLPEVAFDSLLCLAVLQEIQYRPSQGVLSELIGAGNLGIIANRELRQKLASWDGLITRVRFQEEEHSRPRYALIDLMNTLGNERKSFQNVFDNFFEMTPSKFSTSSQALLNSLEFDNQLTLFYATGRYLNENYYSALEAELLSTLEMITGEVGNRQ